MCFSLVKKQASRERKGPSPKHTSLPFPLSNPKFVFLVCLLVRQGLRFQRTRNNGMGEKAENKERHSEMDSETAILGCTLVIPTCKHVLFECF
jgi:hypothetical protein